MVVFVSIFLGLLTGSQTVEVAVSGPVAGVEIRLDGKLVGELAGAPWRLEVDFGDRLAPHELEAIARDAAGTELDRETQWINMPRATLEAELMLEESDDGRIDRARIIWSSVLGQEPELVAALLDGKPLAGASLGRIPLPALAPEVLHQLRVVLDFGDRRLLLVEQAFGGAAESSEASLTGLPVRVEGKRPRKLQLEQASDWLSTRAGKLEVAAIDSGSGSLVVVRDPSALEILRGLGAQRRPQGPGELRRELFERRRGDTLQIHGTRTSPGSGYDVFDVSPVYTRREGDGHELISRVSLPTDHAAGAQVLADAVASAAVAAAATGQPRLVLLILGSDESEDASRFSTSEVKAFLAAIRVPLRVWQVRRPSASLRAAAPDRAVATTWGTASRISSPGGLSDGYDQLRRELDSQRVLWIEGRYLPDEVVIAADAPIAGLR